MNILITGGTGSFGQKFLETIKKTAKRVVIYSRDEHKQYDMAKKHNESNIRYFIGDVRDKDRLKMALTGIDTVVHAAALKHVPTAEYNPFEVIKTNILGAQNVIESCIYNNVRSVVALSTDKAASPVNLYGATKLCADKLFLAANNMVGAKDIKFSVVRYGNVFGSRGSVVPLFRSQRDSGSLTVTDPKMTRFTITLEQAVEFVKFSLEMMEGGELFVPKLPSYHIIDLARAMAKDADIEIIGLRPGEKVHEELITESESRGALDMGSYYVVRSSGDGKPFSYRSDTNDRFLSIQELREMV